VLDLSLVLVVEELLMRICSRTREVVGGSVGFVGLKQFVRLHDLIQYLNQFFQVMDCVVSTT